MGLLCPAVVHGSKPHGRRRDQPGLTQPALQSARGRDELGRIQSEQVQADTSAAPARMLTSQLQASLPNGLTSFADLATAALGARRQVVAVRQVAPLGQQITNGALGKGQFVGDVLDGKARVVQHQEALTQWRRGSTWHERGLLRRGGTDSKRAAALSERPEGPRVGGEALWRDSAEGPLDAKLSPPVVYLGAHGEPLCRETAANLCVA
jgi:hypothetical protein